MKIKDLTKLDPDCRSYLPSDLIPSSGLVGVEIELEGFSRYHMFKFKSKYWTVKQDGSLRDDGLEFIFNHPLSGVDIERALFEFETWIKSYSEKYGHPNITERCSVHVHVDMRDATVRQAHVFILLYMTFETMFFHEFGKDRDGNNYCIPVGMSAAKRNLSGVGSKSEGKVTASLEGSKYTSLNTGAVYHFGSFEIRLHEGTYDSQAILKWVCILLSMKEYSDNHEINPLMFPTMISEIGLNEFVADVFDHYMDGHLYRGWQTDVMKGMRIAQDTIIYEKMKTSHIRLTSGGGDLSQRIKKFADVNNIDLEAGEE